LEVTSELLTSQMRCYRNVGTRLINTMGNKSKKQSGSQLSLMAYAKRTVRRYQGLDRREKRKFLDEVQLDFGGHRKAIIRLYARLAGRQVARVQASLLLPVADAVFRGTGKPGRGRRALYQDATVVWWLQTLWIAMNQVSEKLMHAMLPAWLEKNRDEGLTSEVRAKLLAMSPSTIERLIRSYKKEHAKKLFCTTKPPRGKDLMMRIPTRVQDFKAPCCGFLEGDTVAHCGPTLAGVFAWTLNTVDHRSAWTEQEAFLSNTAEHVVSSLIRLRTRLPFRIRGFHSDGGSEFINGLLYEYLQEPQEFVTQTHGRAYKKNDQARVEQRNWVHVRQIFGYVRISEPHLVAMMNDIYRNEWRLLNNFFTAMRKQTSKIRVASKFKRSFDQPKTPYARVLEDATVSEIEKQRLRELYATLDPFELKKNLDRKLRAFHQALKDQHPAPDEDKKEVA